MRDLSKALLFLLSLGGAEVSTAADGWDRDAAARYLDARAELWTLRARARQKLDTACISCHTAMPYLLSRAALVTPATALPEAAEALFGDVEKRVAGFEFARVWYDETRGAEKPDQSRGTESVMNALVLTMRDRRAGGPISDITRTALAHMWSQQKEDGHWSWIHFGLGPWETDGSDYWGATLGAVAAMSAKEEVAVPEAQAKRLESYLRSGLEPARERELSLHNRLALLWASSVWPGLLSADEAGRLVEEVVAQQQPDGGFRLVDLGAWSSRDGSQPTERSDGYATGFTVFVLESLHTKRASEAVGRGLSWLEQNQKADGRWETLSPNKDRSKEEDFTRLLASDAATAFAVLALDAAAASK